MPVCLCFEAGQDGLHSGMPKSDWNMKGPNLGGGPLKRFAGLISSHKNDPGIGCTRLSRRDGLPRQIVRTAVETVPPTSGDSLAIGKCLGYRFSEGSESLAKQVRDSLALYSTSRTTCFTRTCGSYYAHTPRFPDISPSSTTFMSLQMKLV